MSADPNATCYVKNSTGLFTDPSYTTCAGPSDNSVGIPSMRCSLAYLVNEVGVLDLLSGRRLVSGV